jgi:cation diffusion facilitator CzcD-associated flavoprotein CzcO
METTMTDDNLLRAGKWLDDLTLAVTTGAQDRLADLFHPDASWRDVLAFTGDLRTASGLDQISHRLHAVHATGADADFKVLNISAAETNTRTGVEALEAVFDFQTRVGIGRGVVRLLTDGASSGRAWTLLTELDSLRTDLVRTHSVSQPEHAYEGEVQRDWLDSRTGEATFEDRDPEVLIVGAGQSGLALAARLREAGIDTLVVDRHQRVGDNWRNRYQMLRLHNEIGSNHLPYMPFPANWPTYIPKDKLADWLEAYATSMELNVWTKTQFDQGHYDSDAYRWNVTVLRDGVARTLRPAHLVLAIGVSGTPRTPAIPGLDQFSGVVTHSSEYVDGAAYRGKRVLVVGSGVSGHDIAQDLHYHGAEVTMMQRSKTIVASLKPGAEKVYAHYRSDKPLNHLDLMNISVPYPVKRARAELLTTEIRSLDADLLAGLESAGFRTHSGSDGTGFQMQFLRYGGGYYIDVGCSGLIAAGKVKILQADDLGRLASAGAQLRDGRLLEFDAIVMATGYQSVNDNVQELLGKEVADRVGPVWGLDDEGELRNVCRPTSQPGLWFIAGGLAEARIFSKYLALHLVAAQSGLDLQPVAP